MNINSKLIKMSKEWKLLFDEIVEMAVENEFLIRNSEKVDPVTFLKTVIHTQAEYSTPTLNEYCMIFEKLKKTTITDTGFDKRINKRSVRFLKNFLTRMLEMQMKKTSITAKLLKPFTEVNLIDSTQIELPESLASDYEGSSGYASKSALKIQFIFDFLTNKSKHFEIQSGASPDQKYAPEIAKHICPGSLSLFDLGYVTSACLENVIKKEAFFICRFPHYLFKVYDIEHDRHEINLISLLKKNKNNNIEIAVLAGPRRIPVRLVAYKAPRHVVEKRMENAKKNAKKKNRKVTKNHLAFLEWSIYITNAPEELVKAEDLFIIYRLRWQIELIFKLWKSLLNLDYIAGKRQERVEFELYSKLILYTLYAQMNMAIIDEMLEEDVELNQMAAMKIFKKSTKEILDKIDQPKGLKYQLLNYFSKVQRFGKKSKSKNKKSTYDLLNRHTKGGRKIQRLNDFDIKQLCSRYALVSTMERIYGKGSQP